RTDAHEAVDVAARNPGVRARRACEAHELLDGQTLHAHEHEEHGDVDLALAAAQDGVERLVRFLVGEVAAVLAAGTENPDQVAQVHAGRSWLARQAPVAAAAGRRKPGARRP